MTTQFETLGIKGSISAQGMSDGDVLISLSSYPMHAQMAMPASAAVALADEIIAIVRNQLKEAA